MMPRLTRERLLAWADTFLPQAGADGAQLTIATTNAIG